MRIIIPIIVGAVIGYFTNWLAIKMLFRPHREVRVLGVKLPFTPGLIPKERYRMSRSIGNAVGEHLLTPEKIRQVLSSEETKKNIRSWVSNKFEELKKNDNSIFQVLDKLNISNYNEIIENIKGKILEGIRVNLKKKELRKEILNYIKINIYDKNKNLVLDKFQDKGEDLLKELANSEETKSLLIRSINERIEKFNEDNRSLREALPEEVIYFVYENIQDNKENIILALRNFLHEPNVKRKIESGIVDIINENVSRIITTFISTDIISEKVSDAIYDYIDSNKLEESSVFFMNNLLEKIFNTELSKISMEVDRIISKDEEAKGLDFLLYNIFNNKNIEGIIRLLTTMIKTRDEEIRTSLIDLIDNKLNDAIDSLAFKESVYNIIDIIINDLFNKPISLLLKDTSKEQLDRFTKFIEEITNRFGEKYLIELIRIFDISKIVEEQINSFDVEFTEELIIEIAERELNAITRLGALLGGIMGVLSPLLQMFL